MLQGDPVVFLFSWWSSNHSSFKHAAQQRADARQRKVSAESLCTTATLPKSVIVQVAKLRWVKIEVNDVQLCKATHQLTTENVEKQQGKEAGIFCSRAYGVFSLFCAEECVLFVLSQGKRKISLGRIVSNRNDWQTHTELQISDCFLYKGTAFAGSPECTTFKHLVFGVENMWHRNLYSPQWETCEVSGNDFIDYVCCCVILRFRGDFKGWCAKAEMVLFHWYYKGAYLCVESMDQHLGICSHKGISSTHFLLYVTLCLSISFCC